MTPRTLEYADLSPEVAAGVGNRLVELAAQADEGQVVRVQIVIGGAVGSAHRHVASELRKEGEAPPLPPAFTQRSSSPRRASDAGRLGGRSGTLAQASALLLVRAQVSKRRSLFQWRVR